MKHTLTGWKCMRGATIVAVLYTVVAGFAAAVDLEQSPAGIFADTESESPTAGMTQMSGEKIASTDCDSEINFDDVTAPSAFLDATRLTEQYADLGVHFEGPGGNDGGAILNELGGFGVTGHSAPNFLAFNTTGNLQDGGHSKGPETVRFDQPIVFFEAAFGSNKVGTVTLRAYDTAGSIVDDDSVALTPAVQRIRVMGHNIARVEFYSDASAWVMDDICIINQGGSGVLHLFAACLSSADYGTTALANLGYTNVTQVTDDTQYEFAVRTGQWDLIILDTYGAYLTDAVLDALGKYHADGGADNPLFLRPGGLYCPWILCLHRRLFRRLLYISSARL